MSDRRNYRVREFAKLAGVTVRALHHYDQIGVLKPRRTNAGYRAYTEKDLETLEQIVALKFIGMPLRTIKRLLQRPSGGLRNALRAQRGVLEEKKRLLERAIAAIGDAEVALDDVDGDGDGRGHGGRDVDHRIFTHIIEVIEMQNNSDAWQQKYDALVQGKIDRLASMSKEARAQLAVEWAALLKDVGAALNEDPAGPRGLQLADRWVKMLNAFAPQGTEVDPKVLGKFGAATRPAAEWPAAEAAAKKAATKPEGLAGDTRIWDFMSRALAARG
jgi:DNA-binding transcriptional MerR regulator